MATTTRVLTASVNGTVYTTNANGALEAIDTCHSGATAPTNEVANGKLWLDTTTTPGILKIYNNATWEVVLTATGTSQVKLDGIEAGANVTDTANVTAAGALMDSEVDADIKTLALPANTTISTFGKSLIDDASASTARSTLGLGTVATTAATAYATSAQGATADSALQPTGDGSGLTNLTSGNLTGALPAIDGSALTGISSEPDFGAGAVGSYSFLTRNDSYVVYGGTYGGGGLRPAGISSSGIVNSATSFRHEPLLGDLIFGPGTDESTLSGTWRCMGETTADALQDRAFTLFLRIL